jgi:hypothetical protein
MESLHSLYNRKFLLGMLNMVVQMFKKNATISITELINLGEEYFQGIRLFGVLHDLCPFLSISKSTSGISISLSSPYWYDLIRESIDKLKALPEDDGKLLLQQVRGKDEQENLQEWKERLLWPVATSYRLASKGSSEALIRLNNYFKLFEMISAFHSVILLSALPEDYYGEKKDEFWKKDSGNYQKVSFGSWVSLYGRLSKHYRSFPEDTLSIIPHGKIVGFYKSITSKKVIDVLNKVSSLRNESIGHGGIIQENLALQYVKELEEHFNEILKYLTCYQDMLLIYPVSMKKRKGIYTITIKRLEGFPFIEETLDTDTDMDTNVLYMYNPESLERLRLLPELFRLVQCNHCNQWSLYIYNKIEKNSANYISYQGDVHPYIEEIEGVLMDL